MDPSRWNELKQLFERALELTPAEQRAMLDALGLEDDELRVRLSRMLDADLDADFIRPPTEERGLGFAQENDEELPAGTRCGPHVIEHLLGSGGMGDVYAGRRDDQRFERRVAVKVLRKTLAGPLFLARFATEREALAALEHRYIARLLDAGELADGRPYIVMERVEGLPVDVYCERSHLDISARLELFIAICEGIEAAHRQLIVHGDIKPSNILITPSGEPRLLDFGIAKVLQPGGNTASAELERTRASTPFTLAYASPEQLNGARVTTATDVYALGLLLYELLTGLRARSASDSSGAQRTASAGTPPRPSDAPSPAGTRSSRRIVRQVRGDLDAIVSKALQTQPEERYSSVAALASDVRLNLEQRPIAARPAGAATLVRKWVARNPALSVVGASLLLSLIVGVGGVVHNAREARRERSAALLAEEAARVERLRAERTADFLASILAAPNPFTSGREVSVVELVDAAAARAAIELAGEARVEAGVRRVLGSTYSGLGRPAEAVAQLERALELESARGVEDRELADTLRRLGVAHFEAGDPGAARTVLERAIAIQRRVLGEPHLELAQTLNDLGASHRIVGELDEAEALYRSALEMRRALAGETDLAVAESLSNLGNVARLRGDLAAAVEFAARALELREQQLPPEHALVIQSRGNLAVLLATNGDYEPAALQLEQVLDGAHTALGPEHPHLAIVMNNLAGVRTAMGQHAEAERLLRDSLALNRRVLPQDNFMIPATAVLLGNCLADQGEHAAALEILSPQLEVYEARFGPEELETRELRARIESCKRALGR